MTSAGKVYYFIFSLAISLLAESREVKRQTYFGVIKVFKAPILKTDSFKSIVLSHATKGDRIYIHAKHFKDFEIKNKADDQLIDQFESKDGFYQVITSHGIEGFIEKRSIYLIYRDFRDHHYHFKSSRKHDLSDYRIPEPLSPNYPLAKKNSFRLNLQASLGPGFYNNFLFPTLIKKERFSNRYGAALTFLKNANFDFEDRFYFGISIKFLTFRNEFKLIDDSDYLEKHFSLAIGPALYYESLRLRRASISHGLELNINYWRTDIDGRSEVSRNLESRRFHGYMLEPSLVNQISFRNIKKKIDFNIGIRLSARPKYELKAQEKSKFPEIWGGRDDVYELEAKISQTYYIGMQVYY